METTSGALAEPLVVEPEPPTRELTPAQWVRANLASSPFNAALTVVVGLVAGWAVYRLARWVFVTAEWTVVRVNLKLFMVGFFPADELWRLWVAGTLVVATAALAGGALSRVVAPTVRDAPARTGPLSALHRFWPLVLGIVVVLSFTRTLLPTLATLGVVAVGVTARWLGARIPVALPAWAALMSLVLAFMVLPLVAAIVVVLVVVGAVVVARARGLRPSLSVAFWVTVAVVASMLASLQVILSGGPGTGWDDWGGLHLVVSATIAGLALAFPLGLLLALGRRSSLPAIRVVSVGYVEGFRAVPLVTLLFLGQYMIGFMFPNTIDPPSFLVRAVIAITLFEAAYIAEIVRGGLQAVPRGQVEAAQAIGLSPVKALRLVVLPQALRAVIPAMVGQFISLFKDTSLLAIVGFFELLEVANAASQQDAFRGQGLRPLTLAFVGLIYWAGCSTMSRESQRLERRVGVGER